MNHQRPLLGFALALLASMTWGTLPLAIQQVLKIMDAPTLVFSRFVVAAVVLCAFGAWRGTLPQRSRFTQRHGVLLLMGSVALALNFVLFSLALHYVSPTTTQVLWQLAPFGMMISGVLVFGEKLTWFQKWGAVLLVLGLLAFFNQNLGEMLQFGTYAKGILLAVGASLIWVGYGVAQKLLLPEYSSAQILLLIYAACALWLSPMASPTQIGDLHGVALLCFAYCCVNTLVGYGAYGEALNHWDASKVSVITTMLPIFTMIFSWLAHAFAPEMFPTLQMNVLSYVGAFVVVLGAILAAVGDKLWARKKIQAA